MKVLKFEFNILKTLRNKQTQNIALTYPKVGVSCYTLYNITFSTVWPSKTWYNTNMFLSGYVAVCMCHCVSVLLCSFVRALNVPKKMRIDLNRCYESNTFQFFAVYKFTDMVYF